MAARLCIAVRVSGCAGCPGGARQERKVRTAQDSAMLPSTISTNALLQKLYCMHDMMSSSYIHAYSSVLGVFFSRILRCADLAFLSCAPRASRRV